jgi:hypothetical protein
MKQVPASIIHLNLKTKHTRKVLKSVTIREEIARLERANGYIEDEPEQKCYVLRNRTRIETLKTTLSAIEEKEIVNNG